MKFFNFFQEKKIETPKRNGLVSPEVAMCIATALHLEDKLHETCDRLTLNSDLSDTTWRNLGRMSEMTARMRMTERRH
jgi:hypothetical protein